MLTLSSSTTSCLFIEIKSTSENLVAEYNNAIFRDDLGVLRLLPSRAPQMYDPHSPTVFYRTPIKDMAKQPKVKQKGSKGYSSGPTFVSNRTPAFVNPALAVLWSFLLPVCLVSRLGRH